MDELQSLSADGHRRRAVVHAAAFLLIVPLAAHLLFSWIGYNPTDEGFTQAYSRRILEGQVPHRDFIIIRPALSPLMHVPEVMLGGQYTYWISRYLVWLEFAVIAICWAFVAEKLCGFSRVVSRSAVALLLFVLTVNSFPVMGWHTIDGMLFAALGLAVCLGREPGKRWQGYLLLAMAYLCKQSFVFLPAITIVLLSDWRRIRNWLAAAAPGLAYALFILASHATRDAMVQFGSQHGLMRYGVFSYLNSNLLLGVLGGYLGVRWCRAAPASTVPSNPAVRKLMSTVLLIGIPMVCATAQLLAHQFKAASISYSIFGMLLGAMGALATHLIELPDGPILFSLLAMVNAWSGSLSIGYNNPSLGTGLIVLALFGIAIHVWPTGVKVSPRCGLLTAIALSVGAFIVGRTQHPYAEAPAQRLNRRLGDVFPGGRLIRTSPGTHRFLADLQDITQGLSAEGKRFALMPDMAGFWVKAKQTNPLPIDWFYDIELADPRLERRVTQAIDRQRGHLTIVVSKVYVRMIWLEAQPPPANTYPAADYVRANYKKVRETEYFEIYE